jgi:hypothetical protein
MSFLFPAFLLGLAALAVPLLLHLIRRRVTRTIPFPALRFLAPQRADERKHRLRRLLVLALRCLALALLAAAFARPFFGTPPDGAARATVVVIDNSFSLQTDGRWPALLRWTREQIGSTAPGDTLGLLLMNPRPAWLVAPTRDTAAALAALDSLAPGWESSRVEPALRLAGEVLAASPARERRLILLGDHQARGWIGTDFTKPLPPGLTLAFPPPSPAPAHQAALLSASLNRATEPAQLTVIARRFLGLAPRTLSLYAEGSPTPLLTTAVPFDPEGAAELRLPLPALPDDTAWLRLTLDPDALPADDTLWLAMPTAQNGERLLLLDHAPAASSADHLGTAYQTLSALPPSLRVAPPPATPWPATALAVLRSDASFAGDAATRLDAFLAAGGAALVFPSSGPAQAKWLAAHGLALRPRADASRVRDWTLDHPLVAPLAEQNLRSLVGWEFSRAWSLPADAAEPLALWDDGSVALGEFSVGPGRVLLAGWTAERAYGDWPIHPAFLPFLHQSIAHLASHAASPGTGAARVGTALTSTSPGTWSLLSGPARAPRPAAAPTTHFVPTAPGLYEFTAPEAPTRLVAVGLAPEESDLSPWPDGTPWFALSAPPDQTASRPAPRPAPLPAPESETQNPLWWWALAAMALFALSELALANRTAR